MNSNRNPRRARVTLTKLAPAETVRDGRGIALNAYRSRFLDGEPHDARYAALAARLAGVERLGTPTLMIQGGDDRCDEPAGSAGQDRWFAGDYRRIEFFGGLD